MLLRQRLTLAPKERQPVMNNHPEATLTSPSITAITRSRTRNRKLLYNTRNLYSKNSSIHCNTQTSLSNDDSSNICFLSLPHFHSWHLMFSWYCCLLICIVQHCGIVAADIAPVGVITRGISAVGLGVMGTMTAGVRGGSAVIMVEATDNIADGYADNDDDDMGPSSLSNSFDNQDCTSHKFNTMVKNIDDIEDLELGVPVNIAFDNRQRKRFVLHLNTSTPLNINFSQIVARKIYFNQTVNLLRSAKNGQHSVTLTCALRGQYDIFVQARHRGSVKIEAIGLHPQANWPLLNRTHCITIRSQNRVRKRQMIVKWDKSKFDFHAVHYCLVVSTKHPHKDFCQAADEFLSSMFTNRRNPTTICQVPVTIETILSKPAERAKKIDPHTTNVICTGSRTQQLIRGLAPNYVYYLDVFGIHTKRQNLTFHIVSSTMHFNRTHPAILKANTLSVVKISGLHGVQVFSFKVPLLTALDTRPALRYLVLPCGGSEVDAKILKHRRIIGNISNIYRPTYIDLSAIREAGRYMIRFKPSNDDEVLRANKVGLAVTTNRVFSQLPELPENITVFEVRTKCRSTKIAWYSSPEIRTLSYCIIVFNLPQRNRSSIDYTNYCMDFGKRVVQHPQFHSIKCPKKAKNPPPLETDTIFNLTPGESYLIYVTANLNEGKPLPYQSLKVKMYQQCPEEVLGVDSRDQSAYYFN
ncbi:neuron derived neurotrophic factor nord [Haematobia irritans]|uniref:neuron derived neurotrophic factor nord n=1 Tax=Haematobia irritans TaxID=7368 RepID=UPI003F500903